MRREPFRAHVSHCSRLGRAVGLASHGGTYLLAYAKVRDYEIIVRVYKYIVRFDVLMDDGVRFLPVQAGQAGGYIADETPQRVLVLCRRFHLTHQAGSRTFGAITHDQEGTVLPGTQVRCGKQVFMMQAVCYLVF